LTLHVVRIIGLGGDRGVVAEWLRFESIFFFNSVDEGELPAPESRGWFGLESTEDLVQLLHGKADFNREAKAFLPPVRYCATVVHPPTLEAKGKADCLWRREGMQNCIASLLEGIRACGAR